MGKSSKKPESQTMARHWRWTALGEFTDGWGAKEQRTAKVLAGEEARGFREEVMLKVSRRVCQMDCRKRNQSRETSMFKTPRSEKIGCLWVMASYMILWHPAGQSFSKKSIPLLQLTSVVTPVNTLQHARSS